MGDRRSGFRPTGEVEDLTEGEMERVGLVKGCGEKEVPQ